MRYVSARVLYLLLTGVTCTFGMFPIGAMAYPATWEFKGTVTLSEGGLATAIPVGSPFRVLVSFDTSEPYDTRLSTNDPVSGLPRPGIQYRYFQGLPSLQFAIYGGDCNPCIPDSLPDTNGILVRDGYTNSSSAGQDGYSFFTNPDPANDNYGFLLVMRDFADAFSPPIVTVTGVPPRPLPVEPDPRMADMAESVFEVSNSGNSDFLKADIDSVGAPTYGTYYFFSGRHCAYPDIYTPGSVVFGDDCVAGGGAPQSLVTDIGGGAGQGDFSHTVTHFDASPVTPGTVDELGTVFGAVSFGGPGGLPVLRGSSFPTEVGRTNANLLAFQEYVFGGTVATPLQLIVDLGYQIHSNWTISTRPNGTVIQEGTRPGGAALSTTLSIVDASKVPAAAMAAVQDFNSLVCGYESDQMLPDGSPWPPGSILGMAIYDSTESEQGAKSVQLQVLACDGLGVVSTNPVLMQPGDGFYLTASIQTPARGKWSQAGNPLPAVNGFVDAANTLRVIPDPAAPPAVLQQLVAGLEPVCTDCNFEPDNLEFLMDVKPGSAVNTIKINSNSVIDVALLGSAEFHPVYVDTSSLRLGSLHLYKASKGKSSCSMTDVNVDGMTDLLCGFRNEASNWQPGQTSVSLTGLLNNGQSIQASDSVKLLP